jgi:hypothetical protein
MVRNGGSKILLLKTGATDPGTKFILSLANIWMTCPMACLFLKTLYDHSSRDRK